MASVLNNYLDFVILMPKSFVVYSHPKDAR
jgi:hypothetical protein